VLPPRNSKTKPSNKATMSPVMDVHQATLAPLPPQNSSSYSRQQPVSTDPKHPEMHPQYPHWPLMHRRRRMKHVISANSAYGRTGTNSRYACGLTSPSTMTSRLMPFRIAPPLGPLTLNAIINKIIEEWAKPTPRETKRMEASSPRLTFCCNLQS
jgi:hypothetical protein